MKKVFAIAIFSLLLFMPNLFSEDILEENKEIIADAEKIIKNSFTDSENRLRLYSIEEELFSVNELDENRRLVSFSKNIMMCKYFDSTMRLEKIEYWKVAEKISDSTITKIKTYSYNGNNSFPFLCVEKNLEKHTIFETHYNQNQKAFERDESHFELDKDGNEKEKSILDTKYLYKYDSKNRVVQEDIFHYIKEKYGQSEEKETRVYEYKNIDLPPDFYYYENNKLHLRKIYSSSMDFTETVYFDGDQSVITEYINERKVISIFMNGKKENFRIKYE